MAAEHKLAAILSADVVGYSRLMADDEAETIRMLTDYREAVSARVRRYRGRVVDAPGDNILTEFPAALDAVRCAVEIQAMIRALNESQPEERRMEFRIGIHLGDVAVEGERIYGDGVNIAARLEALAQAGGICVSGSVCEQVESKLDLELEDLSEQALKNIAKPVRVYRLAAPQRVSDAPTEAETTGPSLTVPGFAGRPAIAVLPFHNMSGDPEQEYFADGIAEDLITRLSSWRHFPVIARNSSFVYKGEAVDVKRVSRELGVRYVVEGSVRKAGDRVRINAQLIDATNGHHVWAERYDRQLDDVFGVQDEITEAIVVGIEPRMREYEPNRTIGHDPANLDAWDLTQRGIWHNQRMTPDDTSKAIEFFEKALALDPESVPAHFCLTLSHYMAIYLGWTESAEQSLEQLARAAERAASIDEQDPYAQLALMVAYSLTGPQERMLEAGRRALEINPSQALAYNFIGNFFAMVGRADEAIECLETGMRLSPKDPTLFSALSGVAWAHLSAQRWEEGIDWGKRSLKQRSDWIDGWSAVAVGCVHLDRLDEAREAVAEIKRANPNFTLETLKLMMSLAPPAAVARITDALRKAGME